MSRLAAQEIDALWQLYLAVEQARREGQRAGLYDLKPVWAALDAVPASRNKASPTPSNALLADAVLAADALDLATALALEKHAYLISHYAHGDTSCVGFLAGMALQQVLDAGFTQVTLDEAKAAAKLALGSRA